MPWVLHGSLFFEAFCSSGDHEFLASVPPFCERGRNCGVSAVVVGKWKLGLILKQCQNGKIMAFWKILHRWVLILLKKYCIPIIFGVIFCVKKSEVGFIL